MRRRAEKKENAILKKREKEAKAKAKVAKDKAEAKRLKPLLTATVRGKNNLHGCGTPGKIFVRNRFKNCLETFRTLI